MAVGLLQTFSFRDAKGDTAIMRMYADNSATLAQQEQNMANIAVDLAALSNTGLPGGQLPGHGPYTTGPLPPVYGATAQFLSVEDKAVFVFADAEGGLHRYQVPCPIAAIFYADLETVLTTNAAVKQFVADMLNATFGGTAPTAGQTKATVSKQGNALTSFIAGVRVRRKIHRRSSIFTKAADLADPAL